MNYDVGIWSRGIDRDIFTPDRRDLAWRETQGIMPDVPTIGFVGRLVVEKGLDIFADTIDEITRRQIRHRVLVIGDGPAREWFQRRLPTAAFVGFQAGNDLGRAVASVDMLFNPSVTETFGNVTLEAMAAGLPVVAARATGSESLVQDGISGRLVQPGRTRTFADALQLYCEDIEERARAGTAGLAISERYGWDQVNQLLVDSYMRIVRQTAAGIRIPRSRVP
jgi:glycosyltransferase involved in cell wall biosynthesis